MNSKDIGAILLAGGSSTRFGANNKLLATLNGHPLLWQSASTLAKISFGIRIVIAPPVLQMDWVALGFEQVDAPENPLMSASIVKGIGRLRSTNCQACLIALGDMPFVPQSHFEALIDYKPVPVLATGSSQGPVAPARFDRSIWGQLSALSGDMGARELLQNAPALTALPHWLSDIDTQDDLSQAIRRQENQG